MSQEKKLLSWWKNTEIRSALVGSLMLLIGFGLGQYQAVVKKTPLSSAQQNTCQAEISLVNIKERRDDELIISTSGPVRLIWAKEKIIEGDGEHRIPWGQIATTQDIQTEDFAYTGNAKTGKFYPSDSYFAGCVAVENRRFFLSKEAAVQAGFIPSKSVK